MTKAVVFDIGGVLIDLDFNRCIDSFKALGFDNITEVLDLCHQRGFFDSLERGLISAEEFLGECVAHSRPGTTMQQASDAFMTFCAGVETYKLDFLRELGKKYRLFCLSNNNPIVVDRFPELCPGVRIEDFFEECFFSYRLGLTKPGRDIFEYALSHIGEQPAEILFVDDSPLNAKVAEDLGIRTVLYVPGTDLRKAVGGAL